MHQERFLVGYLPASHSIVQTNLHRSICGHQALGSRHIRQMGGAPAGSWTSSTTSNPLRA